jgi:transcriptional regulator with XRE-family HTH domain
MSDSALDRRLAESIRAHRLAAALSLELLAERTGVSRAMLSRIERGESSPTAQLLNRLCGGLGISLSALFAAAEAPATPVARRADQPVWRDPASGYLRRAVSPPRAAVSLVEVIFPAGRTVAFDPLPAPAPEQQVWVLAGGLDLTLGDAAPVRLLEGDCLWMRLDAPIRFHNPTQRETRYLVALSRSAGA